MNRIERILMPTDFSDAASRALPWATQLAMTFGAELHVLHVDLIHEHEPAQASRFPGVEEYLAAVEARTGELFDELLETAKRADLEVHRVRRRAISAGPEILSYADEQGMDLIVMSTHGRRGLGRALLGSVTQEVVRRAECPVLTLQTHDPFEAGDSDLVLVPVDLTDSDQVAIDAAVTFARETDAQIELLHVIEPLPVTVYAAYPELPPVAMPEVESEVDERLEGLRAGCGLDPERVHLQVLTGSVVLQILERVEQLGPDLLVQASSGPTPMRWLLGSVAEAMVARARCPVLTVKG